MEHGGRYSGAVLEEHEGGLCRVLGGCHKSGPSVTGPRGPHLLLGIGKEESHYDGGRAPQSFVEVCWTGMGTGKTM